MAEKPRRSSALARLADCVTVAIDGKDIRVPVAAAENKVLNCLVISRARTLVEEQIKKYNDLEAPLTPRELKDLIDAIARVAESSAEIYSQLEGQLGEPARPKTGDPVKDAEPVTEVNFDDLTKPKTEDAKSDGNTSS